MESSSEDATAAGATITCEDGVGCVATSNTDGVKDGTDGADGKGGTDGMTTVLEKLLEQRMHRATMIARMEQSATCSQV